MMRTAFAIFAAVALLATPAQAQTTIAIDAGAVPVVDAQINGHPVRLELDLRFPDGLALSTSGAQRLGVRRVPIVGVRIGIEGSDATMRGRIARPRLVFEGGDSRAFAGIFPAPVSSHADGVIGPGALPYDVVTINLGPDLPEARDIVFTLDDPDDWTVHARVGGQMVDVNFDVGATATVFNRPAARLFDIAGAIPADGALVERTLILGLRTMMQPVRTELTVEGLALGSAFARTNSPLLGATEEDAIVVQAEAHDPPPPRITLGRDALARCAFIRVDRRSKQLTLRCAA